MKFLFFFIAGIFIVNVLQAQKQPYPQGYFIYPVDKAKVGIVANFGELRPNHWHMGLDCRTNAQENFPILAAAEGYISKVKIEPYGFGNAIYIAHPNGFTTLYAHLNDFYPELQAYVKAQQYAQKNWKIFIDIPANKFPVTKGQFIAKSGNTGGSMGPHLHFEIRDTKTDKVLNPLRFGFPLPDNVKPTVTKLVIYDRNKSIYEQTPMPIALQKKGTDYFVKDTIRLKTDCASVAIGAYDQISNTPNQNGIFGATLFDNNQPICGFRLDSIGYNETRFLNAHIDFKMKFNGGGYVQHISALPGNSIAAYTNYNKQNGQIDLSDGLPHSMSILVSDANSNYTNVYFVIIKAKNATSIKDSTVILNNYFMAGQTNSYEKNGLLVNLSAEALYDRMVLNVDEKSGVISNTYNVHYSYVPLHNNIFIGIKPTVNISDNLINKIVMLQTIKTTTEGFEATLNNNGYYAIQTRDFGTYKLAIDTIPPNITPNGFANNATIKGGVLRFVIKDNFTAIKKANLYLDDEWILLGYKGNNFYYKVDDKLTAGTHILKIVATDAVGNETVKTYTIKK